MLHQQFGVRLIGFTKRTHCSHCNNDTPLQVYQDYVKNRAFLIPVGTQYSSVFKICPVCEAKTYIIKWSPGFSSSKTIEELVSLLNEGREYTKLWFAKLDPMQQQETLKRLNSLKAYDLVKYVALGEG
jgi:hypothetical protein